MKLSEVYFSFMNLDDTQSVPGTRLENKESGMIET